MYIPIGVIFFVGILFLLMWFLLFKGERAVLTNYELHKFGKFGNTGSRADYIRYYRGYERQYYEDLQDLERNKKNNKNWRVEEELLRLDFLKSRKQEKICGFGALIFLSTWLLFYLWG